MPIVVTEQAGGAGGSGKFIKMDIPANIYEATLVRLEESEEPDYNDKSVMKPALWWYFEIRGKEKSIELNVSSSMKWSRGGNGYKKSKMYDWACKMLGDEPPATFDVENLIGKKCRIVVEKKQSTKDGSNYVVIKDVMGMPAEDADIPF